MPLCPTGILQNPAEPCPVFRRGRCLHRPTNPAMPQTPCGGRSRPPGSLAEVRKDIGRARHRTAPLSRLTPPAPLTGEPSGWQALYKASPARGCGVERRLRRRKRDGAGLTVAEHKRASARAVRCGHRKPDGGCAVRRRRRGALPACGGDIPQSPAATLPATTSAGICQARRPAGVLPKCPYRPAKSDLSSPDFGRRHSNLTKIITLGRAFDAKWKFPPECRKTA